MVTMTNTGQARRTGSLRTADTIRTAFGTLERLLAAHSITALRISVGLIFTYFGMLKFFPGASPAEALATRTIDLLTLGMVPAGAALLMTAVIETFVGLTLITGVGLRVGLVVLYGALAGIMSPLVLFPGKLFDGVVPTLEAQYILKNVVVACAGAVVAAKVLGARLIASR
jgi:putative oxidoreductase